MNKTSEVSEQLRVMLEDFVYNVLKNQPADIYKFSADYFNDLHLSRNPNAAAAAEGPLSKDMVAARTTQDEVRSIPSGMLNGAAPNGQLQEEDSAEDEGDDDLMDMPELPARYSTKTSRRHSVAAESVDPEKIDYSQIKVYEKTDEQRARLREVMKNIFIFRSLEQDQIPRLIDAMFEREVTSGETVIKQGDNGDNFYVIEKGVFEIFVNEKLVGNYDNCGSFGELALMYNTPRAATIVAKTAGILWAMDRDSFLKIVLHAAFKKRRMYEELLASAAILKPLGEYERTNLADALFSRTYTDSEVVCQNGELGDEMFFVEEGQVSVLSRPDKEGVEKVLKKIDKGGYFGELALITDGHRNATIKAVGDVKLAVLDRSSFERLMGPCVELMKGQSKTYLDEIKEQLGEEALSRYPALLTLLEQTSPSTNDSNPSPNEPTTEPTADSQDPEEPTKEQ